MAEGKTNAPPPTEVLPGQRRDIKPEDLAPPQGELANPINPEADTGGVIQQPPVHQEVLEQPGFTIEEGGEQPPEQPPAEEPPEQKALRDTQTAFHESRKENAELKKMLHAVLANQQLAGAGPQAPTQPQGPPAEFFQRGPTQEEMQDPRFPANYVERRIDGLQQAMEHEQTQREMRNFVRANPDWPDLLPVMQQIRMQNPYAYQGPGALEELYSRAKEQRELESYRQKQREIADRSLQAGAQMQGNKGSQPFTTPKAGATSAGVPRKGNVPPADFAQWDTDKQKIWLTQHGYVRPD